MNKHGCDNYSNRILSRFQKPQNDSIQNNITAEVSASFISFVEHLGIPIEMAV